MEEKGKKKRAIIFDLDGVLVDSEPVYQHIFYRFLLENGCYVEEAVFSSIAGASSSDTWKIMATLWREPIEPQALHNLFRQQYPDVCIPYAQVLVPGVRPLLAKLKERGYILALASSSSKRNIDRMLSETGLNQYFSYVVSGEQFLASKPDPEIYVYTCAQIGLPKEECLVVEDSDYGILAGKAAGLQVVAITDRRFDFDQGKADWQIERIYDLWSLLKKWENQENN